MELLPQEQIRTMLAGIHDHYIVCGAGFTGFNISQEFYRVGLPFVVVEQSMPILEQCQHKSACMLYYLQGDATEDDILLEAGIERAKGVIAALSEDKDNIFVALTARSLNPDLRIVLRLDDENNVAKAYRAGADAIVQPHMVSGMRMTSELIRPEVVRFFDETLYTEDPAKQLRFTEIPVEQLRLDVDPSQPLRIADVGQHTDLMVVAIRRGERYIYKPSGATELQRRHDDQPGDILVVVGTQAAVNDALKGASP